MGKIPQGILGGVSGAIGGVVGSSWKGINVIKSKPLSVANPKTAGQVAQRTKFSNTVDFAKVILSTVIKPLWDRFASKMSGYNAFVSENIDLFEAASPSPTSDLVISKGKMAATLVSSAVAEPDDNEITVNWADDSGTGFKLASDEVFIVIIDTTNDKVEGFNTGAKREDGTVVVEFAPEITAGDSFTSYLAFRRADGTVVSNTDAKAVTNPA